MRFPRLPLPPVNYSSLEAIHTTIHTMIYIKSQHEISPLLSWRPAEMFQAHVTDILPCSPTPPFWFGAGGRIPMTMITLFICSTSVRRVFFMSRSAPADQSSLRSSIARVDPHRSRWSRARRSLLPYHDVGRFQALYFRWADRQEGFWWYLGIRFELLYACPSLPWAILTKYSRSKIESSLGVIWTRTRKKEASYEGWSCFSNHRGPYHHVRNPLTLAFPPQCFVDLVVLAYFSIMTLGRLTSRHKNGLSCNALGPFHPPVQVMWLFSSMILCMYMVGIPLVEPT